MIPYILRQRLPLYKFYIKTSFKSCQYIQMKVLDCISCVSVIWSHCFVHNRWTLQYWERMLLNHWVRLCLKAVYVMPALEHTSCVSVCVCPFHPRRPGGLCSGGDHVYLSLKFVCCCCRDLKYVRYPVRYWVVAIFQFRPILNAQGLTVR